MIYIWSDFIILIIKIFFQPWDSVINHAMYLYQIIDLINIMQM